LIPTPLLDVFPAGPRRRYAIGSVEGKCVEAGRSDGPSGETDGAGSRSYKIDVAFFNPFIVFPGGRILLEGIRMRLFVSALVALLALPAGAGALTVDEVVNRYVEARGGSAKLDALRSLR